MLRETFFWDTQGGQYHHKQIQNHSHFSEYGEDSQYHYKLSTQIGIVSNTVMNDSITLRVVSSIVHCKMVNKPVLLRLLWLVFCFSCAACLSRNTEKPLLQPGTV